MDEKKKSHIDKYMNTMFGNLNRSETKTGNYIVLETAKTQKKVFIFDKKYEVVTFASRRVTEPIMTIFKTEYNETHEYVKDWLREKYTIDCIDVIGEN